MLLISLALVAVTALIAVIAFVFISGNRAAAASHLQFTVADVEQALAEVISPDACCHDAWDLFLTWPIADPYLESIRQRCLEICRDDDATTHSGRDLSVASENRVRAILKELRAHKTTSENDEPGAGDAGRMKP